MRKVVMAVLVCLVFSSGNVVFAGHPLITDDTGTQGKGKFQLEMNGQYDNDKETTNDVTVKTTGGQMAAAISYGFIDSADLVLGMPYLWNKVREDGVVLSNEHGISDATLDVKWRFFEIDGFSLAVKPGISIPTGNDDKGLGTGRVGYHLFGIVSKEFGPLSFHLNLGYIRNENTADELQNVWHASAAATYEIVKNLKLAGDIGVERNPDKESNVDPAYILGGVIYSVAENFDIDFGVKYGLTKPETDYSVLAGITLRL